MSIETELRTYLQTQTPITDKIKARMYPQKRPQGSALPAITYQRVSGGQQHTLEKGAGYATPRIQIDCWASSYQGARDLAEAVRGELQGYSGAMGTTQVGSVVLDSQIELHEPPQVGDEVGTYRVSMDFLILHFESIPTF